MARAATVEVKKEGRSTRLKSKAKGPSPRTASESSVLPFSSGRRSLPTAVDRLPVAALRAFVSDLVSRSRFTHSRYGKTFRRDDGQYNRDLFIALGYEEDLTFRHYNSRYLRGGIAARIIEIYPHATWADGTYIQENPTPGTETPFEKACLDLFERLEIWNRITRLDILAGIGHYAVLLIGGPGKFDKPLSVSSPDEIAYLTPYDEDCARIASFVADIHDPRFGEPEFYDIKLGSSAITNNPSGAQSKRLPTKTTRVHWTRVIHFATGLLRDQVFGSPRLERVWNYLDDIDKLIGGGSEAAWKRMDPGMQVDIDPEIPVDDAEMEAMDDQLDEFGHGLRRYIQTRGTKITPLAASVAGFGPNADAVVRLVTATTGVPFRIFIGSEQGELASNQDRHNWSDKVNQYRTKEAGPFLLRDVVGRFIAIGALPAPSKKLTIVWPKVQELDESTKAEIVSAIAAANNNQMSAEGKLFLTSDEMRDILWSLKPIPKEILAEMEKNRAKKAADAGADKSADLGDPPQSKNDSKKQPKKKSDRGGDNA